MRRSQVQAERAQQAAAARAAHEGRRPARATPRSTRRSTASSTCAPRASGEVVNPGQPVVTLINPDDLWVRADVEETYIDRVRIGDTLTRAPAVGRRARGHGVLPRRRRRRSRRSATSAAPSATSRRSRSGCACDNTDRRLAVGMTAYVLLPRDAVRADRHGSPSTFENIVKKFGDFTAVNGISLRRRGRARSSACSGRTAPASRR